MRLVASWTGEIELPQGPLVSRDRRSLLLLDLTGGVKIEAARAFGLEGAGLTARDAVATSTGVLVTGRWQDLARDDSDVFLGLFPR
jgi:hypothetical protein